MKTTKSLLAMLLCLVMVLGLATAAFAANESEATIDHSKTASLTLYKYDMTSAEEDGAWSASSYVSTGICDDNVNLALAQYAIQGVEFTYLKVADIYAYEETEADGHKVMNLYGIAAGDALLDILGLTAADAYTIKGSTYYFVSDTLIDALEAILADNSTTAKANLEAYIAANGGTAMDETDEYGKSSVEGLELGLYLLVETRVPENVTSTTDPFLVSLPSTTIDGDEWNYNVTVYPKNETGMPTLDKTVREDADDTGKNDASAVIDDGFDSNATASAGDVVEYQIISTLPTITSPATALSVYTYVDELSKGIRYNGELLGATDVVIEFFTDAACTDLITTWSAADDKFAVEYSSYSATSGSTMSITMTAAGLAEINAASTVYDPTISLLRGYSDCTMRITYSATINSDATAVLGNDGNPNTVTLTWQRSNMDYYDTLTDDCHVYTYGIDLTKEFSGGTGDFANVKFIVYNQTDGYYVAASYSRGVYYVTDHVATEAEATVFSPTSAGKLVIQGLEDDTYIVTEIETDDGFTLLDDDIEIVISTSASGTVCSVCGDAMLVASATVNDKAVDMGAYGDSVNALVPLKVVNTYGFNLPKTGDAAAMLLPIFGSLMFASAAAIIILIGFKKKNHADDTAE